MGNCQAADTASIVIQHPNGKAERVYWPLTASQVMKSNPDHYVALLISSTTTTTTTTTTNPVRLTRIKLLKPTDTLVLGQVYRLISTQEVMKGLWAKKQAKMKKNLLAESALNPHHHHHHEMHKPQQENKGERQGSRTTTATATATSTATNAAAIKSRTWQPSLHSISEAAS